MRHLGEDGHLLAAAIMDDLMNYEPGRLDRVLSWKDTPELRAALQAIREHHKDMSLIARQTDEIGQEELKALQQR